MATVIQQPHTAQTVSPTSSFSPSSSVSTTPSTSTTTSSPTSPHSSQILSSGSNNYAHPATRQLRPPKSPMYIPAALRPTERPPRSAQRAGNRPPTPPRSSHSSAESLTTNQQSSRPGTPSRPSMTTSLSQTSTRLSKSNSKSSHKAGKPSIPALNTSNVQKPSTTPSSPVSTSSINTTSNFANHQHPTRAHWKPDSAASLCDEPGCNTAFGLLSRRHHCRRCGGVFCATHSAQLVPLDVDAEFDPTAGWFRACGVCGGLWERRVWEWEQQEQEREIGGNVERSGAVAVGGAGGERVGTGKGETAASVPKDWNWSTF